MANKINVHHFDGETHETIARKEGSLIIYECPLCDYKITFDETKKGPDKMKRTGGDPFTKHHGVYGSPLAASINSN